MVDPQHFLDLESAHCYPGGHTYAIQTLITELCLLELHLRDLSWLTCTCIPEKHLPTIAGIASENYGFTTNQEEKLIMATIVKRARELHHRTILEEPTHELAETTRKWARNTRKTITSALWYPPLFTPKEEEE